jgi:hypothetical protein
MEIKKSKVKSVQPTGTWQGNYGLMYLWEIEMENGDTGQYMSKAEQQSKFTVGVEAEYEWKDGQYPKIKPHSSFNAPQGAPKSFNNASKDDPRAESIVSQSSLKAAIDYCNVNGGDIARVLDIADTFKKWVLTGEKPKNDGGSTDLPF